MHEGIETSAASSGNPEVAAFDVVLYPHRSLGRKGFIIVMALISGVSFITGLLFYLKGAWPVAGFVGLDVVLIYVAFKLNYRDARRFETLRLGDDGLIVRRSRPGGKVTTWRFEPFWVRVDVEQPLRPQSRLVLSSHGNRLALGGFLTLKERLDLAEALRRALDDWRAKLVGRDAPKHAQVSGGADGGVASS